MSRVTRTSDYFGANEAVDSTPSLLKWAIGVEQEDYIQEGHIELLSSTELDCVW